MYHRGGRNETILTYAIRSKIKICTVLIFTLNFLEAIQLIKKKISNLYFSSILFKKDYFPAGILYYDLLNILNY